MPADRNGREDALPHSLLAGAGSERIVNCSPAELLHDCLLATDNVHFWNFLNSIRNILRWVKNSNNVSVVQAQLAVELALPYASIALVTDYDCWRDDELQV